MFHSQYDWTTGVPDDGNEWRKFRALPRSHPLRSLVCTLFKKGGNRRAFRLPGVGGDHFHCKVEPSPGHIRCRNVCAPPMPINYHLQKYHLSGVLSHRPSRSPKSAFFLFFRFLPFFSFHFQQKTGRHRSRDPFCKSPILVSFHRKMSEKARNP